VLNQRVEGLGTDSRGPYMKGICRLTSPMTTRLGRAAAAAPDAEQVDGDIGLIPAVLGAPVDVSLATS